MKININKTLTTPLNLPFNLCCFGEPSEELSKWVEFWNFETVKSGKYTNILLPDDVVFDEIFESPKIFDYLDGFSPNLNKHLHIGHLSNFITAKAIQSMGIAKSTIAVLGDTLDGEVTKVDALNRYKSYLEKYGYVIDQVYYASEQKLKHDFMVDGEYVDEENDYRGCKVFNVLENKVVGVKSNGTTSYFYQDVAIQQELNGSVLYLTGFEQNNHFGMLKYLYPETVEHIGLGLVTLSGKKMSSSAGNVVFMNNLLEEVNSQFNGDENLAWNVLAGHILKYSPSSVKKINMDILTNPKESIGLYISYTISRVLSAGVEKTECETFKSKKMRFLDLYSKFMLAPNFLFKGVVDICNELNNLYEKQDYNLKTYPEKKIEFQVKLDDVLLGMKKLGLFIIEKV